LIDYTFLPLIIEASPESPEGIPFLQHTGIDGVIILKYNIKMNLKLGRECGPVSCVRGWYRR